MQRLQYRASVQGAPGIHILGAEEHRRPGGRSNKLEGPAVEINAPSALVGLRKKVLLLSGKKFSLEGGNDDPPWHIRFRRPWYEDPGSYLETTASPAKSDAELLMKRGELVQYRVGTILEFQIIC